MKLSNNRELYEYLLLLASQLESRGAEVLSKDVSAAARTANAFPATEFLGESRIALRRVLAEENSFLSQIDLAELQDVLGQLDAALDSR
ncbi:MAG: hypothetical protein WAL89_02595 [Candidatus Sulfotelmatobacter sp.]|jgi:hypothetical protein